MFIETNFSYGGISNISVVDGTLKLVNFDKSVFNEKKGLSRKTQSVKQKNLRRSFLQQTIESPIKFKISICKDTEWTDADKIEVTRWLIQDSYKDFKSDDSPYIYKCIALDWKFYDNSLGMGYADLTFECDGSYVYTEQQLSQHVLTSGDTFEIDCKSNLNVANYKPEIEFTLTNGSTAIKMVNLSNSNSTLEFTNLLANETVYVDNENGNIISDTENNRLGNLVKREFLSLAYGINTIQVTGNANITVRAQYPVMI